MTKVKGLNLCNATCGVGRRMAKKVAPEKVSRLDREFLENGSKKLTKLFAAIFFLFLIGVGNVWGTDEVYKALKFPDDNSSSNGLTSNQYTSTWTAIIDDDSWSISNFNNNNWNNSWTYIKAGPKPGKKESSPKTSSGTITTSSAIDKAITKVVVTGSGPISNTSITGTKLIIASNSTFTSDKVEISGPTSFTDGKMTFTVSSPTAARYYQLEFNLSNSSSNNGAITISQVDYYIAGCTDLGYINGSVSWSGGTSATLTWDKLSNVAASTPYTITCKQTGGSSAGSVGSVDLTGSKATCTITGLTAGNSYDFKIAVSAAIGYCDKDSTITSRAPKITATTDANLVDATYAEGSGPSTNASYFTFSGVGLTGDVTVTAPTNFLVSKTSSSSGFDGSVTVSPSTGSITDQKIWICLASGLTNASSPYGGNVALSGGSAASVNVAVTGSVSPACTKPTVATPTLSSIASGTITPSCASVTVADNCDVTDYGFVWKASSDPTIDDNKTSLGDETPASAFSSDLSISFTTGNTYKIKAYAINSAGTTLSSTLTVTPQKVTFNSNGGSEVDDKYVNKDAKVTAPSDPTKSGYDFDSWRTTSGLTTEMNFNGAITKDTTLYAKWNPASYDVTLKANGGSSADQVVSATYTQAMPTTVKAGTDIVAPTYNGYTFAGYYDNADYTLGTQYYTDALASAHNWDKASTANLYGRWIPNEYVVTLDANGGVDGATTSVNTTFGQAMPTIATANLPTREGYRFDGFYTSTDTKYYNADGTSAKNQARYSDNQVLYAHWKALTYFSVNGTIDGTLTRDDGAAMPSATVPTTCGDCWAFLGWSEDSEESSAIDYASGDTHTFGTPTTLYAVFGQVEYKLITSTSGLVANDNYVITYWYISADTEYEYALSNTAHGTWLYDATATSVIDLARINADGDFLYNVGSNNIWKFTGTSSSGQLYNAAADKYLNLSSTSACMLNTTDNLTFTVVDDIYWKINSTNNLRFYTNPLFEADASKYSGVLIYHQVSSTVTTTPSCETYDIVWKVGNDEASGTPTDNTTTCTGIEELPDDPDDNALDCATKFMGWSESILTGEGKSAPADLFTTASGAPKINEDKTFHAVFASVDTESETPTYLTSEFTSSSWADENSLWTSGAAGNGYLNSGVQVTGTGTAYATTKASYNKVDSVEVTYCTNAKAGAGGIKIEVGGTKVDSIGVAYSSGTGTDSKTIKFKSASLPLSGAVKIHAKGSTSSIYIQSVKIYYRTPAYKDYVTVCCDKSITIGTPSITGEGIVTFTLGGEDLDPGDDVETCTSVKDVVATVTPAAGYSCTAVSFSGGSVSVDPTPGAGNYPAAPSTQDYTLSFAKETTSATLSTSATFTAKALTAWVWKYKKGNVGGADPASVIPDVVEAYIGEYVRFVIDGYTPSDVIAAKQGYVYDQDANPKQPVYNTDSLAHVGHSTDYYTTRGKVAGTATIKFKAVGDGSITKTMTILTKALPSVTFVDIVHNKTDFTNWGTDGVVSSTVTTGVVTHTKPTPSHSDVSDPGSNYNTCERNHIHLVGWIRSDWADEHPGATHSQITSVGNDDAGNPYYYAAGADVDVEAQNGKTFYAVWSKIE